MKEKILTGILKRLGLNGIPEENCYFVALTWDSHARAFFKAKDVPNDCLPVFLDSNGKDVFPDSLRRIGWLGYTELNSVLNAPDSSEYVAAFATMLDTLEPSEAFYSERRSGRWSSFPEWVLSLASDISSCFDSRSYRKEGSFSIRDENGMIIAKIIPKTTGVFVGVREGLSIASPPESWKSAKGRLSVQLIRTVTFLGWHVTTLAEASDFVLQLKGRVEGNALPSEEASVEEDAGL